MFFLNELNNTMAFTSPEFIAEFHYLLNQLFVCFSCVFCMCFVVSMTVCSQFWWAHGHLITVLHKPFCACAGWGLGFLLPFPVGREAGQITEDD